MEDKEIEKRYYTIGEVAEIMEVNTSLVRFWEKEFDILQPKRNKKGNRLFTQKDLANLKLIYHLVKERGFTLDGAKSKLRENKDDTAKIADVVERLKTIRQALMDIKHGLWWGYGLISLLVKGLLRRALVDFSLLVEELHELAQRMLKVSLRIHQSSKIQINLSPIRKLSYTKLLKGVAKFYDESIYSFANQPFHQSTISQIHHFAN